MRIRKGDRGKVLTGKDRGKVGEVMRVIPARNRVIVDGVNVAKRSTKAKRGTMQGGIIDKDMPVHASTVAVVCAECGPTRVGFRVDDQGRKIRVCRKCGGDL